MIDFSELSLAEAEAYRDAYAAGVPERVTWLRRQVEGSGGPVLDRTPESLVPLWAWYLSWLKAGGRLTDGAEGVPAWQHPERPNRYVSPDTLWMVDAIGCYLYEVLRGAVPDVRWEVYRVAKRLRHVDQHRTVVTGLRTPFDPASAVYGLTIGMVLHGEPEDSEALLRLYRAVLP